MKTFQHERLARVELTVVFVTRQKIHAINRRHLGHNYATDVITFDLLPQGWRREGPGRSGIDMQGEIFVSTDAAIANAPQYGSTVANELFLYIVHGILHLLGYDDHEPGDITKMRRKEAALMSGVGKKTDAMIM